MKPNDNWVNVPMPEAIARRPKTSQGLPVPFINHVYGNGEADLRILDPQKVERCVNERLCAICGEKIGSVVVFIGGPTCLSNRLFADPGMHEECARYASLVCPFLAIQNVTYARDHEPRYKDRGVVFVSNPLAPPGGEKRPEKMFLYFTNGYGWVLKTGGIRLIRAYSHHKLEWF